MPDLDAQVVEFVAEQVGVRIDRITPETTLFGDLKTDGDDGVDLLREFGRRFDVDMTGCDPNIYFGPEACFPPLALVNWARAALAEGSAEERAGLCPLRVSDLVRAAEAGRWSRG